MTQQMPNDEVDTAIILEGEIKRRVAEVVEKVVVNMVGKIIHEELNKYKSEMLMEVCLAVGKTMQVIENEGRKPLWEAKPEDFGLTHEELNRSHMQEDTDYAIR
jgi:hypothetical protein